VLVPEPELDELEPAPSSPESSVVGPFETELLLQPAAATKTNDITDKVLLVLIGKCLRKMEKEGT
jgi:hypothetical protein